MRNKADEAISLFEAANNTSLREYLVANIHKTPKQLEYYVGVSSSTIRKKMMEYGLHAANVAHGEAKRTQDRARIKRQTMEQANALRSK